MEKKNKKSLGEQIQKNPFLIAVGLIVAIIVLVTVFTLSSAIQKKTAEIKNTTAPSELSTAPAPEDTTAPSREKHPAGFKTYDKNIRSASVTYDENGAYVTLRFMEKQAMLDTHYATSVYKMDVRPVFCFYVNHGTQLELPATLKLSEDGLSATYSLTNIEDLKNVISQTDGLTLTYENVMDVDFNLYLVYTGEADIAGGRTLAGSFGKTVEQLLKDSPSEKTKYTDAAKGIENVTLTVSEKFAWVDVYFTDEESYQSLNYNFSGNAVKFRAADSEDEMLFNVTRYDDLCMLRLKFDSYSLSQLIAETGDKSLTIPGIFEQNITVFSTDYSDPVSWFTLG